MAPNPTAKSRASTGPLASCHWTFSPASSGLPTATRSTYSAEAQVTVVRALDPDHGPDRANGDADHISDGDPVRILDRWVQGEQGLDGDADVGGDLRERVARHDDVGLEGRRRRDDRRWRRATTVGVGDDAGDAAGSAGVGEPAAPTQEARRPARRNAGSVAARCACIWQPSGRLGDRGPVAHQRARPGRRSADETVPRGPMSRQRHRT